MLRGYRSLIVAAVGWLILTGATPSTKEPPSVAESQAAEQNHQAARAEDRRVQRNATALEAGAQQEQADAERTRQREDASDKREADDLVEQRRAADAATRSSQLAIVQTWIAGIGIVLLLGTMWAQIAATRAATRAVDAQMAIERARVTPRLSASTLFVKGNMGVFDFQLCNAGKTAATVRAHGMFSLASPDFSRFRKYRPKIKEDSRIISNKEQSFGQITFPLGTASRRYIAWYFRYQTKVDGRYYSQTACIEISGVDPKNPKALKWAFMPGWPGDVAEQDQPWHERWPIAAKRFYRLIRDA